jgi:hypothetical protein
MVTSCGETPIVPRRQAVLSHDTNNGPRRKDPSFAGAEAALVQCGRNLGIGLVVQQPIDLPDHLGAGRPLLPSIEWNRDDESPGDPSLESNVSCNLIVSDQRYILQY